MICIITKYLIILVALVGCSTSYETRQSMRILREQEKFSDEQEQKTLIKKNSTEELKSKEDTRLKK